MGRRTLLLGLLALAVVVAMPVALRADGEEEAPQFELVVRDSAAAAAAVAGVDLEGVVRASAEQALTQLPRRSRVQIEVRADPAKALPETGVGGEVAAGGVFIYVDRPLRPGSEPWLRRVVAHELHHAVRIERRRLHSTVLEALVSEGLADHFAREAFPDGPEPPWTEALRPAEEAELWAHAEAEGEGRYDHAAWFYGTGDLPRFAGYRLGHRIVAAYLERTGRTAAAAVADHPETIVAAYRG